METKTGISLYHVELLKQEARLAGDEAMVALCALALAGDEEAFKECVEAIRQGQG